MDEQQVLIRILDSGWAQCAAIVSRDGGILLTALIAGLVGSVTHCVGMCGPFVISQVTSRMEALPVDKMSEFRRLTGAALVPYQTGRLTTYIFLGALAGFFADGISALLEVWWISPVLLLCAAIFFLVFGILGLVPHIRMFLPASLLATIRIGSSEVNRVNRSGWWGQLFRHHVTSLFAAPFGVRGYVLGLMLGFIPCGLVYGALVLAASGGNILTGAFVMACFGIGTVPMLFVTGYIGQFAARRYRDVMVPVGRGLMIVNAGVLVALAWHQIA